MSVVGISEPIHLNTIENGKVSLVVNVIAEDGLPGQGLFTVQHSLDGEHWLEHDYFKNFTSTDDSNYSHPVAQIRLVTSQVPTNGYIKLTTAFI